MRHSSKVSFLCFAVLLIAFFLLRSPALYAQESVASIKVLSGDVAWVKASEKKAAHPHTPEQGTLLHTGDRLLTKETGMVVLSFKDGTLFTLGKNTDFLIKEYPMGQNGKKERFTTFTRKGTFQFKTGKLPAKSVRHTTPMATIGIRGSGGRAHVRENGETLLELTHCCLRIAGNDSADVMVLEEPGTFSSVTDPSRGPSKPRPTPAAVRELFQQHLDARGARKGGKGAGEENMEALARRTNQKMRNQYGWHPESAQQGAAGTKYSIGRMKVKLNVPYDFDNKEHWKNKSICVRDQGFFFEILPCGGLDTSQPDVMPVSEWHARYGEFLEQEEENRGTHKKAHRQAINEDDEIP